MADAYLLDTSAVFALTDDEEGADEVQRLLDRATGGGPPVLICTLSLMEVYYVALQEEGEDHAARLVARIKSWPIRWAAPAEKDLLRAGRFKAFHRLSFADAVIAAVACNRGAVLMHKDPEFEALAEETSLEALPFKGG